MTIRYLWLSQAGNKPVQSFYSARMKLSDGLPVCLHSRQTDRPLAKANELIMCFWEVALEAGLKGDM